MSKIVDMTGRRIGQLTVVKRAPNPYHNSTKACWLCRCDCGKEIIAAGTELRRGYYRSCGCQKPETARQLFSKHGMTNTRLFKIWSCMKSRCYYTRDNDYKYYGARGITVCDEWLYDFKAFATWALSHGYTKYLTIDRINFNGNYEPSNCRWATSLEQSNNKRGLHMITINCKTQSMAMWCRKLGVNYDMVKSRIRNGWDPASALTMHSQRRRRGTND